MIRRTDLDGSQKRAGMDELSGRFERAFDALR